MNVFAQLLNLLNFSAFFSLNRDQTTEPSSNKLCSNGPQLHKHIEQQLHQLPPAQQLGLLWLQFRGYGEKKSAQRNVKDSATSDFLWLAGYVTHL